MREKETLLFVESIWPFSEGLHSLLHLPLVRLIEDRAQDLLDPRCHLPAPALLLHCSPIAPQEGVVVVVSAGGVSQDVPGGL